MREYFFKLRPIGRREGGNVAIIAALAVLPMMLLLGLAIDLQRISSAKMRMQATIDGALLAEGGDIYKAYLDAELRRQQTLDRADRRRTEQLGRSLRQFRRGSHRSLKRYLSERRTVESTTPARTRLSLSASDIFAEIRPFIKATLGEDIPGLDQGTISVRVIGGDRVVVELNGDIPLLFGGLLGREDQTINVKSGIRIDTAQGGVYLFDVSDKKF